MYYIGDSFQENVISTTTAAGATHIDYNHFKAAYDDDTVVFTIRGDGEVCIETSDAHA